MRAASVSLSAASRPASMIFCASGRCASSGAHGHQRPLVHAVRAGEVLPVVVKVRALVVDDAERVDHQLVERLRVRQFGVVGRGAAGRTQTQHRRERECRQRPGGHCRSPEGPVVSTAPIMTRPSRGCNATPLPPTIFGNCSTRTEAEVVADKLTHQILDALTRVAAEPTGLALYASKADAGLFPNTALAKPAAQKCLADDLLRVVGTDANGKAARDRYGLTDKGWEFLLAAVNPKQVLEDFVRVLEARAGEVGELLATARRMADSLQGLKDAVARVLPGVTAARVAREEPLPPAPSPKKGGGAGFSPSPRGGGVGEGLLYEAVALLDAPPEPELAPAVLAHLTRRAGATDCTLPELFRALADISPAPSIGAVPRLPARSSTPTGRSRCTRGPGRCTPCPNRSSPCSSATVSPFTPRSAVEHGGSLMTATTLAPEPAAHRPHPRRAQAGRQPVPQLLRPQPGRRGVRPLPRPGTVRRRARPAPRHHRPVPLRPADALRGRARSSATRAPARRTCCTPSSTAAAGSGSCSSRPASTRRTPTSSNTCCSRSSTRCSAAASRRACGRSSTSASNWCGGNSASRCAN